MQLTFRIDNNNFVTFDIRLEETSYSGSAGDAEIAAAVISDHKLSDLEMDQLADIVGQTLDHWQGKTQRPGPSPQDDWRDKFRRGEL